MPPTFVVVGANVCGGRAVEALRERGFDGRLVLIGAEADRPYERPPLSKGVLRGEDPGEEMFLRPSAWYDENAVELRLGAAATGLEPTERRVHLADGSSVDYDALLIATGTMPRRLEVPGTTLEGVHYLRTRRDAIRIAAGLASAERVAVIGAGFIGAEVAASARTMGKQVTLLEALPVPLGRALGDEMGALCGAIHHDHGVDLRTGVRIEALRGNRRVEEIALEGGESIPCDMVVVGVGVSPADDWLVGSGIDRANGVLVDARCRTSLTGVFAAGDVARWPYHVTGEQIRVEHFDNAGLQGQHAAAAMLGADAPYTAVPYFWSDQYEHVLQYVGHARGGERLAIRGDLAARAFAAFYVEGDRVNAAFVVGREREMMAIRRLIGAGKTLDIAALTDASTDLRALARAATRGE